MLISAAGEIFEDFRAEMANFMSKWGTLVVYGKKQSCQEFRAEHRYTFQLHSSQQEGEPEPHYGVLPSSINEVSRSCPPMSAFLLQDPGPWRVLQAMDGSGELCM